MQTQDTEPQKRFDAIVRLMQRQLAAPLCLMGVVDGEQLRFKAESGLGMFGWPRGQVLCEQTLLASDVFEVCDCRVDTRFANLPLVTGPAQVRFYAGAPLIVDGHAVGILAVLDRMARRLSDDERQSLLDLAAVASALLHAQVTGQHSPLHSASASSELQAKRLLSEALECLSAGVMISDPQGRVVQSNAIWRESVGRLATPGSRWPDMVRQMVEAGNYPDAVGNEENFIRWRLSTASDTGERHELRWGDHWVIVSDRRLSDGSVVHLSMDITERKQFELSLTRQQADLRDSQGRLGAVLNAVPDLWFVLDAEGRYLECSSAQHPMLTQDWECLRGQPFSAGVPEKEARQALAAIAQALHSGKVQRHEYELATRDGLLRNFEARISPMSGERVLYVSRDLTELRGLERHGLLMQRALEAEASLPIGITDARHQDMPLVYVNPAFERLTGYNRDETLGRSWRFLQHERSEASPVAVIERAVAEGKACNVVMTSVRKDGSAFTNAMHLAPVTDSSGVLTHYIAVLQDVSEQSQAADKLRVSEELYRSVASAISDGLLVVTPGMSVLAVNPAGCAILGVEQTTLLRAAQAWPFELLDKDAQPLSRERHPVQRVVAGGEPSVSEVYALLRADAQMRWIELNAHPLQLRPEGSTYSVLMTFRDVTQQRAAEQALVVAEERWKFALEGSGGGVWDWDVETNTVFYSARWKETLGYAEHEIGDTMEEWTSRVHPEDLQRVMSEIRRHLRGDTRIYQSEHRLRHRDGHDLWVLDRGKVVGRSPAGRALRLVGTHSDITLDKQAEQTLRDKQAAELASRAKSEFLSRMSHEMRTPLNAVIGFSQLMCITPAMVEPAKLRDYADHVLNAGRHLLALINDVLDLQKVEEGALSLLMQPVALDDAALRTMELVSPMAQAQQIRFDTRIPPGLWVRADPQRLRQVLLNIVSNAVKYNRTGGTVRWSVEGAGPGRLALCVEDDGHGMTPQQMARLFQPFERLGKETSSIEGTGLGLIIARSLTHAIGGELEVASKPGLGTRVRIELQCDELPTDRRQAAAPATQAGAGAAPGGHAPLRMLYVEDNRINAILFEETLRTHSDRVELRIAEDGEEAITAAQAWRPDVLVLDAHLPRMTGFDLLRLLRALPGMAHVPAYMCSADAMPDDVQRAYEAGFVGYWSKPIDIASVMAEIGHLVDQARSESPV